VGVLDFSNLNLASRRKFNQQKVLCECILQEMQEMQEMQEIYATGGEVGGADAGADVCIPVCIDKIQVCALVGGAWSDLHSLRAFLESHAPYKSKHKYCLIMNLLLSHTCLSDFHFNLQEAVPVAVRKILTLYMPDTMSDAHAHARKPDGRNSRRGIFPKGCIPVPAETGTGGCKRLLSYDETAETSPKKPMHYLESLYSGMNGAWAGGASPASLDINRDEWAEVLEGLDMAEEADICTFDASSIFYDPLEATLGAETPDSNPWILLDEVVESMSQPPSPSQSQSQSQSPPLLCDTAPGSCGSFRSISDHDHGSLSCDTAPGSCGSISDISAISAISPISDHGSLGSSLHRPIALPGELLPFPMGRPTQLAFLQPFPLDQHFLFGRRSYPTVLWE
jgi:hypothetical protein